jgi:hypothetical protein
LADDAVGDWVNAHSNFTGDNKHRLVCVFGVQVGVWVVLGLRMECEQT